MGVSLDQELFELCKDVYERTGWMLGFEGIVADDYVPAYTSDYLLEKLPRKIQGNAWLNVYPMDRAGNDWGASYDTDDEENLGFVFAGTPLKALLKLTISLHEAGELKDIN